MISTVCKIHVIFFSSSFLFSHIRNLFPLSLFVLSLTGSVVGRIYNSSSYEDGDVVWTSPISKGTIEDNAEVATESGSRYFLAPQTGKEDEAAASKPTQEVLVKPVLRQSPTKTVTPDNLYEVLQGISGAVHEMKEASLGLSAATENIASGLGGKVVKKKKGQAIDVVLGAQWGDEGKGKLVDMLSQVSFVIYDFCSIV